MYIYVCGWRCVSMATTRRISSWVVAVAMAVVCLAAAAAQIKVAVATGTEELGDVGEYWQKRTQESRLRNRGGPLHDLVAAATRFHQGLLDHRFGRRYLLGVGEEGGGGARPSNAEAPSTGTGAGHNTLADHDIIGA